MPNVPVTILGGLPVIAEVWFSGPDYDGEYDAGVDGLYWQKADGSKGAPLSQKIMDRVEKEAYWEAYVTEQASEWLSGHVPTRRYVGGGFSLEDRIDHRGYITEGEYSKEYLRLNPRNGNG